VSSLVIRILLPLLVIVVWIGGRPSDFGYRLRGVTSHAWLYLLMFLVMLPLLVAASYMPAFQAKYPMYAGASRNWTHFGLWELAYGVQFLGVEGFFRGFMTFGLYPRFGYLSLFIMVIPYALVHVGKPPIEVFMAVPAGLLLGYVALKSRSWVFGALLHWAVGITMDSLAIWHAGGFRP
jgi:membrane protease YdiL (CAAX protease family)